MSRIQFDGITKRYSDGFTAVNHLDLDVADGEFLVLVGPSGCGKSTALRIVAGLEDISDGRLSIDGRVVNKLAPRERDVAMVFQSYALYPHLTVRENIGFGLRVRGYQRGEIAKKVEETARILELTEHLDRKPAKLSGGQRQRVAMGRAIARTPKAFLMDEPLSNLDAKLRVQMRAEITTIQKMTGITTIYVTHDQVEAMTMGTRVAVMKDGRLQQLSVPRELYRNPANMFVAGFIGSPSMNLLTCTLVHQSDRLVARYRDQTFVLGAAAAARLSGYASQTIVVGVRPEHLQAVAAPPGPGQDGSNLLVSGRVLLVEDLGATSLVHVSLGDTARPQASDGLANRSTPIIGVADLLAILDGESRIEPSRTIQLSVPESRVHFFDPESGAAV